MIPGLGATFMEPSDSDANSTTKMKVLAQIDTAMGGHVAEKLFIGDKRVTTGCSGDLKGATDYAYRAVMRFGMFGEDLGYMSSSMDELSEEMKAIQRLNTFQLDLTNGRMERKVNYLEDSFMDVQYSSKTSMKFY